MSSAGGGHDTLSRHDNQVLNSIFNPNLPYSDPVDEGILPNEDNGKFKTGSENMAQGQAQGHE